MIDVAVMYVMPYFVNCSLQLLYSTVYKLDSDLSEVKLVMMKLLKCKLTSATNLSSDQLVDLSICIWI